MSELMPLIIFVFDSTAAAAGTTTTTHPQSGWQNQQQVLRRPTPQKTSQTMFSQQTNPNNYLLFSWAPINTIGGFLASPLFVEVVVDVATTALLRCCRFRGESRKACSVIGTSSKCDQNRHSRNQHNHYPATLPLPHLRPDSPSSGAWPGPRHRPAVALNPPPGRFILLAYH